MGGPGGQDPPTIRGARVGRATKAHPPTIQGGGWAGRPRSPTIQGWGGALNPVNREVIPSVLPSLSPALSRASPLPGPVSSPRLTLLAAWGLSG